jgi:hypothetical protein
MLIQYGADIHIKDGWDNLPLCWFEEEEREELEELFDSLCMDIKECE